MVLYWPLKLSTGWCHSSALDNCLIPFTKANIIFKKTWTHSYETILLKLLRLKTHRPQEKWKKVQSVSVPTEWVNYRCSTVRYCGRGRTLVYLVYSIYSNWQYFCQKGIKFTIFWALSSCDAFSKSSAFGDFRSKIQHYAFLTKKLRKSIFKLLWIIFFK